MRNSNNTYRVAAVQMTSGLQVEKNLQAAAHLLQQAAQVGAELVVLPEMFTLMGAPETTKLAVAEAPGAGPVQDFLAAQARLHNFWVVGGTTPIKSPDPQKTYNSCFVYNPQGEQVQRYDKIHLFDVTVKRDFETYQESTAVAAGDKTVVVDTPFGKLGLAVCYDIRFPELFRNLLDQGMEIFAIPTAFTAKTGQAHWELLLRARAVENFCYAIGACQSGTHANGRQTYGHSMIVDPWGTVMACLAEGTGVISADIDREKLQQIRQDFPSIQHRRIFA